MSLRIRLIASIAVVMMVSLGCGTGLVVWRAAGSVRTELHAALDVGAKTIRNGVEQLMRGDDRTGELLRLIATFDGNRHVRALLLDTWDQAIAISLLDVPTQAAPDWFRWMIADELDTVRLALPQATGDIAAIVLRADPVNEIGEVWVESRDAVLLLSAFAVLSAILICIIIRQALQPIEMLSTAFQQIGAGNYYGRLPGNGPPEMVRLINGFNLMSQQLAAIAAQNLRLNERLVTLQAEERAELARDLHDEIGPLLFAVDMTSATIGRLAGSGRADDIPPQLTLIHDAVGRMQRHVRAILVRLRPIQTIGLAAAVDRLVAFWRSRHPDINFTVAVAIDDDRIGDAIKETIYRIVQEGVSNAIRHGKPSRVDISLRQDSPDGICVEVADDGVGMAAEGTTRHNPAQLGLVGMRERVMAMTGSLLIRNGDDGAGLTLVARLPYAGLSQSHALDESE